MEDRVRDCLGFRLGAAWRRLDRLFNQTYAPLGLSHAHAQVLLCVLERGEARMSEIVPLTGLTQPTVSRLTADLTQHRYLRRQKDPQDSRAQLLSPSKRAERIAAELRQLQQEADARVRRELAEPDAETLRQLLDLVARHY